MKGNPLRVLLALPENTGFLASYRKTRPPLDRLRTGDKLIPMFRKMILHSNAAELMAGKKNMAFGFFYLLFAMGLGMVLSGAGAHLAGQKALLNNAVLQGNIDAVLNIVVGYLVCRLPFVEWLSKAVSLLMIAGALFHSGVLYLAAFGLLPRAVSLLPVGGFLIIAVMLLMGIGVLGLRIIK